MMSFVRCQSPRDWKHNLTSKFSLLHTDKDTQTYLSTFDAMVMSAVRICEYPVLVLEAAVSSDWRVCDGRKGARGL